MSVPVRVPTRTTEPLREAPGVVTVLTREEIINAGARDLIDVLHLVPGFAFGVDVQGVVSTGFRGNWGEEGKVLVLVDGQEMNETLYLTPQFGNHFPIEHIERVEIMRGPGSVIYGGYAELAVIHIITRSAKDLEGISVSGYYGQMEDGLGRRNLSLSFGHVFDELDGLSLSLSAFLGQGRRSDAIYRDLFGNSYRLTNANLDPAFLNLGAAWRGLKLRFIFDDYRTTTRDAFDESLAGAVDQEFRGLYLELEYDWKLRDRLTLTPRFKYKRQTPWKVTELPDGEPLYYDKTADRILGGLTLRYKISDRVDWLLGAEAFTDRAWLNNKENIGVGLQRPLGGAFHTFDAFAQMLVRHSWSNLSAGARYEYNSRFGSTLLPRLGLTRVLGPFHVKLLFSRAFKAPGHENFVLNPDLRPEQTTTYEVETGYRIGEHVFVGANLFDLTIRDPIVFFFDEATGGETYLNFARVGTRGLEAEARAKARWGYANLKYSFYTASGKNEVPTYAVPGRGDVLRGFPAHKVTLDGSVALPGGVGLHPSAIWLGARYGTLGAAPGGGPLVGREDPTLLLNVFLARQDLFMKGLDVGVGVHNALDQELRFLQPHDSDHAPLPGPTREWVVRVTYLHGLD